MTNIYIYLYSRYIGLWCWNPPAALWVVDIDSSCTAPHSK